MHLLVISPEVVMEVEARMKRNYLPPMLPPRKHSRHSVKTHLPTVQEQTQGKFLYIIFFRRFYYKVYKIRAYFIWLLRFFPAREPKTMERFSPVRRGSEGSAGSSRTLSPSTPQQECQRLQRGLTPRASPPRSIPGIIFFFKYNAFIL